MRSKIRKQLGPDFEGFQVPAKVIGIYLLIYRVAECLESKRWNKRWNVSLLQKLPWCLLVLWKLVLCEEVLSSVPVQGTLDFATETHSVSTMEAFLLHLWVKVRAKTTACNAPEVYWETMTNNLKEDTSCHLLKFLLVALGK